MSRAVAKNYHKAKIRLIFRDGYECCYCGKRFGGVDLTVEHFLSKASGGNDSMDNLVLACEPCNKEVDCLPIANKLKIRDKKRSELEQRK